MRRVGIAALAALTMVVPAAWGAQQAPRRPAPRWVVKAPMAQARTEAAYAVTGNRVVIIGGFVVAVTNSTSVELYDIGTNTWREGPPLPIAVNHGMAAGFGRDVYQGGGYAAFLYGATNHFAVLRDGEDFWTPLAPMPETRAAGAMVEHAGKLYVIGGFTQQGELATTTLVYDVREGTWSTLPGLPTPREHLTAVTDGHYLYAIGGRDGHPDTNTAKVDRYRISSGEWTTLRPLLTKRSGHVSAVTSNGLIVSAGGEHSGGVFDSVEAYDLRTGRRFFLPPLEPARTGFAGLTRGTSFWVFSGASDSGYLGRTEVLDLRGVA